MTNVVVAVDSCKNCVLMFFDLLQILPPGGVGPISALKVMVRPGDSFLLVPYNLGCALEEAKPYVSLIRKGVSTGCICRNKGCTGSHCHI